MNGHIILPLVLSWAAAVTSQDPVPIRFQIDPVLVQTRTEIVVTVLTVTDVLTITWNYPGGETPLGLWANGGPVINNVAQYLGRVTIGATQLRISDAQLRDAGNYSVEVAPMATTGLDTNSRSIQLRVFDAVAGVSLSVPSVALEGGNVTLSCTWKAGTETSVQWGKGGSAINPDSRITISAGSLVINPTRRGDAGEYSCTVSNPVSARTAKQSLTVYYGPDIPVLTKATPAECVGGGDAVVGQTVRLTCVSDSLPPALFSWQHDEQPVASGQPDSGVLSVQTFSANQSGRYTCVAKNAITGGTSEQGTDLAIVGTCLSGGAVAGIVIGCLVALILIILAIVLLVCYRNTNRRLRDSLPVLKSRQNPQLIPPDPLPHGTRDLQQSPHPPLHDSNTDIQNHNRLYTIPREGHGNRHSPAMNGPHNSNIQQHNGLTHVNGLPHNVVQNVNSYPHNGIDNPAFTHAFAHGANTLPHTPQQSSNILIQAGTAPGGTQPPMVHLNLNTLPSTGQQNNNAQLPTIHFNLNSYPSNGQPTHQSLPPSNNPQDGTLLPLNTVANHSASQNGNYRSQNMNATGQRGLSYPDDHQHTDHLDRSRQPPSGLIPTGHTHVNRHNIAQQHTNTQTYPQDLVNNTTRHTIPHNLNSASRDAISMPRDGSSSPRDRGSRPRGAPASAGSRPRQMPWDRLRGTPAYPNDTAHRGQASLNSTSGYSTDYTSQPPIRQATSPHRTRTQRQNQTTHGNRGAPPQASTPTGRGSHGTNLRGQNTPDTRRPEADHHVHTTPRSQRERSQQDFRGMPQSHNAPRQADVHSSRPEALQGTMGHANASQAATTPQGPAVLQGTDTRALADPNHLPQAHMAQQQTHEASRGLHPQTQPVLQSANPARQGDTITVPYPSAMPSNLTPAALQMHTQKAQTFQNRKQQTMAALLHPGRQPQATAPGVQRPPNPPPVIPMAQFQALPKEHTRHTSPTRGPRPPVNIPMAQRHPQMHQRLNAHHLPAAMHANPHHHPGNAHAHGNAHRHGHAPGHRHPAHPAHLRQDLRGRPKR